MPTISRHICDVIFAYPLTQNLYSTNIWRSVASGSRRKPVPSAKSTKSDRDVVHADLDVFAYQPQTLDVGEVALLKQIFFTALAAELIKQRFARFPAQRPFILTCTAEKYDRKRYVPPFNTTGK